MHPNLPRRLLSALVAAAFVLLAGLPAAAQEDRGEQRKSRAWSRKNEIDKLTAKRLQKAQEQLANEQYDEANATLDKLRVRSLNEKEKEKLYTLRGYLAYGEGDLQVAKENLELAIAQGTLDVEDLVTFRFQIGQICLQQSLWQEAIGHFEQWFEIEEDPNANAYYLLALAHWQLDDIEGALEPANEAVELTPEPQERWLQLLLAVHLTQKNYVETIPIFDELIRRFPKKSYWIQLSTLHGALGNYEESLVPMQLAYTQGLLTEDEEIRRLAELLLFLELPIRAVAVMRDGLGREIVNVDSEFYELLSNSLIMAREYDEAVEPLTRAAELDQGGRIYLRLAEVHVQRERWGEATEALGMAIEKGDLPDPGQAELLMGIAYYSQKRLSDAKSWFVKAKRFDATKGEASTWLEHLAREEAANAEV